MGVTNLDSLTLGDDLIVQGTATFNGGTSQAGAQTVTSNSASALAVGPAGATNSSFLVDASTASAATGIKVKSAAAASGVALSVISSGTNENLTIDAKGSGTITLGSVSTGNIVLSRAMTGVSASVTGLITSKSATAVPASAGAVAAGPGISMFSTNISVWVTSDAPTFSATKGDICINTGGSSSSTRLYINNGTTNWVAITTAT